MKRFLFFITPIILAIIIFSGFTLFLSQSTLGKGALQVTSVPLSDVYLNGKLIGRTPLCKCEGKDLLATGTYTVKLVPTAGENLSAFEEKVTITKGILTVVDRTFGVGAGSSGSIINLTPLGDARSVQLFVSSFPSDARVLIDGNEAGNSPFLVKSITDSDHEVTLQKSGYKDKTLHVHTVKGYQLNSIITMAVIVPDATAAAAFTQNASLSAIQKPAVVILQTPTGFLRVRTEPTLGASETAQVKPGDTFDFIDEQNGWYEIKLTDGKTGWVNASYAQKQ